MRPLVFALSIATAAPLATACVLELSPRPQHGEPPGATRALDASASAEVTAPADASASPDAPASVDASTSPDASAPTSTTPPTPPK